MAKPLHQEQRSVVQARKPHVAPALAHDGGVRRMCHDGLKRGGPADLRRQQGAAHEVHVIAIAVIGRAQGDDRLERRRPSRGDLQRVEPAPGNAHHADRARTPCLARDPGDDFERVVLLLRRVFVAQQSVRFTAAANIDTNGRIAVRGEPGMRQRIALPSAAALAVRQVFQDRRNRVLLGVFWQPNPGRQSGSVGERDPGILDFANGCVHGPVRWVRRDGAHGRPARISLPLKP